MNGMLRRTGSALVQRMQQGPDRRGRRRFVSALSSTNCRRRLKVRRKAQDRGAEGGAQLVVYTLNEKENLVLLDSEFIVCVRLGFVVVGGLEDGEVCFWIVGHVGEVSG
jgi:hypothetical protein